MLFRCYELHELIRPTLEKVVPMNTPTLEESLMLASVTTCYLCGKQLGEERDIDHCHLTGDILGAAHPICNRERQVQKYIPIVFHNMAG